MLGEEPAAGGTARYVDSSVERVQARVARLDRRTLRARLQRPAVPLHPTDTRGRVRRRRALQGLAPARRAAPDDRRADAAGVRRLRPLDRPQPGRLTHHVAHPGGRNYETFPVNANEAEARRRARFFPFGHTPGPMPRTRGAAVARTPAARWICRSGACRGPAWPMTRSLDEMVDAAAGAAAIRAPLASNSRLPAFGHWRGLLAPLLARRGGWRSAPAARPHFSRKASPACCRERAPIAWRCDPIPLPLAAGRIRRARGRPRPARALLEAILADVYGPQHLLAEGVLPPALVYANPAFLRPCRAAAGHRRAPLLHFYAADLMRGPDGAWRVLAGPHRPAPTGLALRAARTAALLVAHTCRSCSDRASSAQHRAPSSTSGRTRCSGWRRPRRWPQPGVALLTRRAFQPGTGTSMSSSLARAVLRAGRGRRPYRAGRRAFLKTLRGLQPVDVLLRRVEAGRWTRWKATRARRTASPACWTRRAAAPSASSTTPAPASPRRRPSPPSCRRWRRACWARSCASPAPAPIWLGDPAAQAMVGADLGRWMVRARAGRHGALRSPPPPCRTRRGPSSPQRILAAPEEYRRLRPHAGLGRALFRAGGAGAAAGDPAALPGA